MSAKTATFAALEHLPLILRMEICFAARAWDAVDMLGQYRPAAQRMGAEDATGWLIASIRAGDEQAARQFGTTYAQRYRQTLPHLGANATILRYRPVRGMRRYQVPRSAPPRVRAAFVASERLLPQPVA